MKYHQASIGRVIVAKLEHGDDLMKEINRLVEIEKVEAGIVFMIGALEKASLVVGPESCLVPPEPVWKRLSDGHELLGIATVFRDGQEAAVHLHASLGRGEDPLTGCIRKDAQVYLVVELILFELLNSTAVRSIDEITGLNLLEFIE